MHVFVYKPTTWIQEYSSCCQGFLVHVNVVTDLTSAYGDNMQLQLQLQRTLYAPSKCC